MRLTHSRIDVNACAREGHPVHELIHRERGETWLVSDDKLDDFTKPVSWTTVRTQEHVLIPLVPYLTAPQPDIALAFAFSLGARVSFDLGRPIRRLHLAIGTPVSDGSDDPEGRIRFYLGFAVLLR